MNTSHVTMDMKETRCHYCPRTCYTHNGLVLNGVFSCFGMIITLGTFIGLTVTNAPAHLAALSYVNGTCTTVLANYTDEKEKCSTKQYSASFPCLQIRVEYKGNNGKIIRSLLHEDEHVASYLPGCSYQPGCSRWISPGFKVQRYKDKWGSVGKSFTCFHSTHGEGALRLRKRSKSYIVHIMLWPAIFSVLFIIWCKVVYCYCSRRSSFQLKNSAIANY